MIIEAANLMTFVNFLRKDINMSFFRDLSYRGHASHTGPMSATTLSVCVGVAASER